MGHPVEALVGAGPVSGELFALTSPLPNDDGGHTRQHVHDHDHHHKHAHDHDHDQPARRDHDRHQDAPAHPSARGFRAGNLRLAAVGLVGGLVPSPSALLVLLGGIALGRAWFGALLVLFYGIGMAAALVGTGLLLVLARNRFEQWNTPGPESRALPGQVLALRLTRALPMLTAIAVIGVGAWIAVRSLMTI